MGQDNRKIASVVSPAMQRRGKEIVNVTCTSFDIWLQKGRPKPLAQIISLVSLENYLLKVVTPADRGLVACLASFGGVTIVSRCKLCTEKAGTIRLPPDV